MNNKTSDMKTFTRGGQITLHNIRMFLQIMDKVTLFTVIMSLFVTIGMSYALTTEYERYVLSEYIWSTTTPLFNPDAVSKFIQPDGHITEVKYSDINKSPLVQSVVHNLALKLVKSGIIGLIFGVVILSGLSKWLKKRGLSQTEDTPIKGDTLASKEFTRNLIRKQALNSDLVLGGLPLIKNKETSHLLFHGTIGSGKSNAIKELLDQIRKRGDRAIIYDKGCNYLEEFYEPNKDILLNPMDSRSKPWSLWPECRDSVDYDSIAAAQIPMPLSSQDPFWVNAARTIFAAAAFEMRNDPNRSIMKLLRYLLTADLDLLQKYLKNTVAETLVSEKIEKTAVSIKSVLATYLKSMKYINDEGDPFSIRDWVKNESGSNFLFITSLEDRHETLKPLITAWLDIAINALLSLPPQEDRRIWLILDEIYSLHQLPYLRGTLSEARKFGGCAVIGLQSYSQLAELYGPQGASAISSLINTRFMFRQPDASMAEWTAKNCGETVTEEVRESISYGANTIRDGVSINRVETTKRVVNYSEIMSLGDLHAYVRLPGKFPVTPVDFIYKPREKKNTGFILRHFDEKSMKEIDGIIEKCEKPPLDVITNEDTKFFVKKEKVKKNRDITNDYALDV